MRSLAPFLERLGLIRADELDIDKLADRLRAEVTAADASRSAGCRRRSTRR
jgi:hypothetical protein